MSTSFDVPPTEWLTDVVTVDSEVGIYFSPTLREDTDNPTFWHWCLGPKDAVSGQRKGGPRWAGSGTGRHQLMSSDPLHLEPSLLCHDCGLHGFVRDGRWMPA